MPAVSDTLLNLAPQDLQISRPDRYTGDGFNVRLKDYAPEDSALILRLYSAVKRTYDLWLYMKDDPNYPLMRDTLIKEFGSDQFIASAQSIGSATYSIEAEHSPLLHKVTHDIRGGALTVLVGLASFLKFDPSDMDSLHQAITTARDHAKLMRNAIEDIDPLVRQADESVKVHPISDFVTKWQNLNFEIAGKSVSIKVNSTFNGNITNRCLETSAIDRILYNYINNAARFTSDHSVTLSIFQINDQLVRWVVQNKISDQHKVWLQQNVGNDLGPLFAGGITRGGHGIGLSSCTDFVAASFGTAPQKAIDQKIRGGKSS